MNDFLCYNLYNNRVCVSTVQKTVPHIRRGSSERSMAGAEEVFRDALPKSDQ